MSDFEKKIVGKWGNDEGSYLFHADGSLTIYWFKSNTTERGSWFSNGNQIEYEYTDISQQYHKGKTIYFTSSEISVTSTSHELNQAIIMRKIFSGDAKLTVGVKDEVHPKIENLPKDSETKSSLKDKTFNFFSILFMIVLIGSLGYVGYEEFRYKSDEYTYFIGGIALLLFATIPTIALLFNHIKSKLTTDTFIIVIIGVIFGIPILYFALKLLFLLLMGWYFIIALAAVASIIFVVKSEDINGLLKFMIILFTVMSICLLFYSRNILKINFEVYFDKDKIEFSGNN